MFESGVEQLLRRIPVEIPAVLVIFLVFISVWYLINYLFNHSIYKWQFPNLTKKDMAAIDQMSPKEFGQLLFRLFSLKGYQIELPKRQGEIGKHFVIIQEGKRTAVRFYKFSTGKRLTVNAVYHALTGKAFNKAERAILITTSHFTAEAEAQAKRLGVELWGRKEIFQEVSELCAAGQPVENTVIDEI